MHPRPSHFFLCAPSSSSPSLVAHYTRRTPMSTSLTLSTWLSQSMLASRSSNLPRATTTTRVLSFYPAIYCGSTSTGFEQCSGGRLFSSKAYCCGHDESLLDINFCCMLFFTLLLLVADIDSRHFEDGYRDSYSRDISEVPKHSVSVAIASLRTRYRVV
ncbi:hypothetical protein BDY19DRAFT_973425 [Irpex rosettiformis]|uniref:Uncharacterized protein n=1 Tax=Irpex rosettiformis TaxID=378272 RepID=A0ACB8TQM7_9APHY|nr:hypothetical protein BDY19DRAFT_973425 [Irpex rosettiformis]